MPDNTIHITMPENGPATVIMQRGDLAVTHTYSGGTPGGHNDKHALERAYDKLVALEADPPKVPEPPKPKPKRKSKSKRKAQAEPTVEIPLAKGTRTVPMSRVKLTGGETDAAAYRRAVLTAARLVDAGLWDAQVPIGIDDAHATYARIRELDDGSLAASALDDFVTLTN